MKTFVFATILAFSSIALSKEKTYKSKKMTCQEVQDLVQEKGMVAFKDRLLWWHIGKTWVATKEYAENPENEFCVPSVFDKITFVSKTYLKTSDQKKCFAGYQCVRIEDDIFDDIPRPRPDDYDIRNL